MGTEEIEMLLGSPLNDPDLVRRAEPVLKKRTFRRTKARTAAIQDLPLTCYFDPAYYLARNPDVRESGMAALRHYIRHGAAEGRLAHPDYDPERYVASVADAPHGGYEAFLHCIAHHPAAGGLPASDETPASVTNSPVVGPRAGTGSSPRVSVKPTGIHGWLDSVVDGVACGWAHDPQQPFKRLEVEIMKGPHVVGRGTAALHRADLEQVGYGDGRCAFAIKLSSALSDGSSHQLTARVTDLEGTALKGERVYDSPVVSPAFDVLPSWNVARLCEQWSAGWKDHELAREFVSMVERCSLLLETDQGEAGLSGMLSIAERHGSFQLVHIKIGDAHLTLNAPELALKAYERALKGEILADWALLGLGNCHRLLGNWEDARDCYTRGLALPASSAPHGMRMRELEDRARAVRARRFLNQGDPDSAMRELIPQFVLRPDDVKLGDMVCEALDAQDEQAGSLQLDAEMMRSKRSVALLSAVLEHYAGSAGGRT